MQDSILTVKTKLPAQQANRPSSEFFRMPSQFFFATDLSRRLSPFASRAGAGRSLGTEAGRAVGWAHPRLLAWARPSRRAHERPQLRSAAGRLGWSSPSLCILGQPEKANDQIFAAPLSVEDFI